MQRAIRRKVRAAGHRHAAGLGHPQLLNYSALRPRGVSEARLNAGGLPGQQGSRKKMLKSQNLKSKGLIERDLKKISKSVLRLPEINLKAALRSR